MSAERPSASIQWKGTEACLDVHCLCGHHGHVDGEFLYAVKCAGCGRVFKLGTSIAITEVTPEQARELADTTQETD